MKYFLRTFFALLAAVIPVLLASQLEFWSQDTVSGSALEQALFRSMNLPGGPVLARRAPAESIAALAGTSHYALRAVEEERALAFTQAEADWIQANNKQDLADFYHRRLEPQKEIDALLAGGRDFARAAAVAHDAALSDSVRDRIYQAWIAHDPTDRPPIVAYLNVFVDGKNVARAKALQAEIARQFPHDTELLLDSEARVAAIDGGAAAALQVYSTHFTPLWPAEIRKKYFELLKNAHQLSAFESQSRADPARLFFYAEQQENRAEAAHILRDWEPHASDLFMLGQLFRRVGDYDSAARVFSKLADKEQSLALLIDLLLDVPEQPLTLGQRDLSLYRNIAEMDPHPGFLNGILSVALNTTFPQSEYQNASQTAVVYFHRAAASRLLDMLRQKFPRSTRLPALDAKLFSAYSV